LSQPSGLLAARVAIYGSPSDLPEIIDIESTAIDEFINILSASVFDISRAKGGSLPLSAIREVVENLTHANFRDVVVSVLQKGNLIKISDRGPGITDKNRALAPGFTTATANTKRLIRGVGSGLPVAAQTLSSMGGSLNIEDNLSGGTVVVLALPERIEKEKTETTKTSAPQLRLTKRQKKVLFVVVEMGSVGPSQIATELPSGLSTAYRELRVLEDVGLIKCDRRGKRSLTDFGIGSLDSIINT